MVKHLEKSDNFETLIKKEKLIVDFYADWCGPCKMLAPILEELEGIDVLEINVDEYPELAAKFGVMSIPTLLFYKNGDMVKKNIGYVNASALNQIIENM
jgi:thioredoxin 1